MAYVSLYRKYRPQTFEELVGQKHVARTLQNALVQGKVSHAYLFCGPRGTGKTTTARLLAKALNCASGPTARPDDTCDMCRAIAAGTAMDVIEMDAASNRGIDEIRALRERIHFAPTQGSYKVYIVDEVHMLTLEAFNALLKVLEEPPEHTIFVLCTTESHKVPATIASRCQRFDFRRLTVSDLVGRLEHIAREEHIEVERGGLYEIALYSQGSLRDAISTLDQLAAFTDKRVGADDVAGLLGVVETELLFGAVDKISEGDAGGALLFCAEALQTGHDAAGIVRGLLSHLRNLYVTKAAGDAPGVLDVAPDAHQRLVAQGRRFEEHELERALQVLSAAQVELRGSPDARLVLEVALVRLARPAEGLDELAERVAELERRIRRTGEGGSAATTATTHRRPGARAEQARPPTATRAPQAQRQSEAVPEVEPPAAPPPPVPQAVPEVGPPPVPPPVPQAVPEVEPPTVAQAAPRARSAEEEPSALLEPSTESLQQRWAAFLGELPVSMRGLVANAEATLADDTLVITVPSDFILKQLEAPEKRDALTKAAATVLGRPLPVRIEVGGAPAQREAVRRGESGPAAVLKDVLDAEKVHEIRNDDIAVEE